MFTVGGRPKSLMSDPGLRVAVCNLLVMTKIVASSYPPNGNGGVERVNNTTAQMPSMAVNEKQNDLNEQLPRIRRSVVERSKSCHKCPPRKTKTLY